MKRHSVFFVSLWDIMTIIRLVRIFNDARYDWLIDYLLFYVPLKNFSPIWRRHHYRWRAAKFRPMLGAQGLWAGRDLYRATPAVTRSLGFSGLIRRTALFSRLLRHTMSCGVPILTRILTGPHSVASYDTQGDAEDLFLPGSSRVELDKDHITSQNMRFFLSTIYHPIPVFHCYILRTMWRRNTQWYIKKISHEDYHRHVINIIMSCILKFVCTFHFMFYILGQL